MRSTPSLSCPSPPPPHLSSELIILYAHKFRSGFDSLEDHTAFLTLLKAAFPDHNTIFASQSEFDLPFSELKKRGRKVMLLYGNEEVVRNQQSGMNLLSPDEVRTDEAKHNTLAYQSKYLRNTSVASFLPTFPLYHSRNSTPGTTRRPSRDWKQLSTKASPSLTQAEKK